MNKKNFKNRLAASLLSAAMLTTGSVSVMSAVPAAATDNDYYEALALSLYMFDANACGEDVDDNCLTWRGNCHTYDNQAAISAAENFDSSYQSLVDPDGDGYVDVSGGYHDAGDHIKFNLTMGFGMSSLAMSEYLNPGVYEKAGCKEHMMAILKRNAEYMMKVTYLDSSGDVATICHVVADGNVDHNWWQSPEVQTYERKTYWLTKSSNNSAVCGEMASALAGAAYVWKDTDASFASECLQYAKAIYEFGTQYKGNESGGLSGFYSTDSMSSDELALAQAWLWINGEASKPTLTPSNGQYNGDYDCYRYTWDKVWQGYAAMMYKATGDSVFSQELIYEINNAGGLTEGKYNGDGWGVARYNCALQMSGYAVANGDASNTYAVAGKWQMDYILGDNPTGYSFLIGYGDTYPTHIHHRAANPGDSSATQNGDPAKNTEAKYTLYGALVGGIDSSGNYDDNSNSYQYTEPALDYNGCFVLACAALADLYGGSDAGAVNIISSASEITYPFTFISGSSDTTTNPTETQATTTTDDNVSTSASTTSTSTTTATTTTTQQTQTSENDANVSGTSSPFTINVAGAEKLVVTLQTNSSDTAANGCFNDDNNGWNPTDWTATPASDGTFTIEYTVPSGQTSITLYVWWPTTTTLVSAKLITSEVVTTSAVTTATSTTTTTTTTSTDSNDSTISTVSKIGDANCDDETTIMDVILINKVILGKDSISDQGLINIDYNKNSMPDAEDSLSTMKLIVGLVSEESLQ